MGMYLQNTKIWVAAFRLRTLPLAAASIVLGCLLAAADEQFSWSVAVLCFTTAILLQILSNLANDYGDSQHGADNTQRAGPRRAVQSGLISAAAMRYALAVFVVLCLGVGYVLVRGESWFFYGAGLLAILSAIAYTAGPKPYGYAGLGDFFVLLFFGVLGVAGTYFLHTHRPNILILLPALSCGLLAVGVLNVNNIRDIISDKLAGKQTIPVRLGAGKARIYHSILLVGALIGATAFVMFDFRSPWQFLYALTIPPLVRNGVAVWRLSGTSGLDPYLKQLALTTMLFSVLFGVGQLL